MSTVAIKPLDIDKNPPRHFLPAGFTIDTWANLEPFFEELLQRPINNAQDLQQWFKDNSELGAVISQDVGWRYIKMTTDTANEAYQQAYQDFVTQIQPQISPFSNKLNKKALESPYLKELEGEAYQIMVKLMQKDFELFREENIPLQTQAQTKAAEYGTISGAMTVTINNEEMTLQQAGVLLQEQDRNLRETVYRQIQGRRHEDAPKLDQLYNELIQLRHQIAVNAGFENYRDYMFVSLGRMDYTPQDCFDFHEAVQKEVVPLLDQLAQKRKNELGVDSLRPWDKSVDPTGQPPLKPFSTPEQLTERTIEAFKQLDPFLGSCLLTLKEMGHLDLESRKGKAPGGYNYPLMEMGVPFIFMNATSTLRDMVTLLHEGGHAVHSLVTRNLELTDFKDFPSEVAELASMSMELITMDYWHLFFENEQDLKRAKMQHLEQIIETLPWVAVIDKFQHWVYENPNHTVQERTAKWNEIQDAFGDTLTNYEGLQHFKDIVWHKQLHLFEVPFYYIEYAIAQLGAVAVWKNYKENPQKGLEGYLNALHLGYTRSVPAIYQAAGIRFDFSQAYIKSLMGFVQEQMEAL